MVRIFFYCLLFVFASTYAVAEKPTHISSPDGNIVFSFSIKKKVAYYTVEYKKQMLIENSALNYFNGCGSARQPDFFSGNETYDLIVGKTSHVNHPYKKVTVFIRRLS